MESIYRLCPTSDWKQRGVQTVTRSIAKDAYIRLEFLPCPHLPASRTGHLCLQWKYTTIYRPGLGVHLVWPYYVLPLITNYKRAEWRIKFIYHLLQKYYSWNIKKKSGSWKGHNTWLPRWFYNVHIGISDVLRHLVRITEVTSVPCLCFHKAQTRVDSMK